MTLSSFLNNPLNSIIVTVFTCNFWMIFWANLNKFHTLCFVSQLGWAQTKVHFLGNAVSDDTSTWGLVGFIPTTSDEPEPSWRIFSSARLVTFLVQLGLIFFSSKIRKLPFFAWSWKSYIQKNFSVLCFMKKGNFWLQKSLV